MSQSQLWRLDGQSASLTGACCSLRLNLDRPDRGLLVERMGRLPGEHLRLLGVHLPLDGPAAMSKSTQAEIVSVQSVADGYLRGADVVATYPESPQRSLRAQIYWRATDYSDFGSLLAIELVASVQTSLLDYHPVFHAGSDLVASEMYRLLKPGGENYARLTIAPGKPLDVASAGGSGCAVFRLPHGDLTYAELVHPSDFDGSRLSVEASTGCISLRHRLFSRPLEKGVILRSRVLVVVVPRANDLASIARLHAAFAKSEPPLTT